MNSKYVLILSPGPFLKGEVHPPEMVEYLAGLLVKARPFEMREQGDLFNGFLQKLNFYIITVEDLLEALYHLPEGDEAMNYWLAFWVKSQVYYPFTVPLGTVREETIEELHGI